MNIRKLIHGVIGRKYYVNIVREAGTNEILASSFIFPSKTQAYAHRHELCLNRSYAYVGTVSFRSRKELASPPQKPKPLTTSLT